MINRRRLPASAIVLLLAVAPAQSRATPAGSGLRLGVRVDYFSQVVSWNGLEGKSSSDLKAALAAAVLQFRIGEDSSMSFFAGYGSSDISGLTFRGLPFSIDYQAGAVGGLALGADFDFTLAASGGLRASAQAEVAAYFGQSRKWNLPGLAVSGSLEGKPTWYRARIGPKLAFGGEGRMIPYVYPFFHYILGDFEMRESVESLSGKENKDIRSRSLFGVAGGLDIPLAGGLILKAEAGVYPRSGGTGFSASVATLVSF